MAQLDEEQLSALRNALGSMEERDIQNVLESFLDIENFSEPGPEPDDDRPVVTERQQWVQQWLDNISQFTPLVGAVLEQTGLTGLVNSAAGRQALIAENREEVEALLLNGRLDAIINEIENPDPGGSGADQIDAEQQLKSLLDLATRYDLPNVVDQILIASKRIHEDNMKRDNGSDHAGDTPRVNTDHADIEVDASNYHMHRAVFNAVLNENADTMKVLIEHLGEEAIMQITNQHDLVIQGQLTFNSQVAGEVAVTQEQINAVARQALGRPLLDRASAALLETLIMNSGVSEIVLDGNITPQETEIINEALDGIELEDASYGDIAEAALQHRREANEERGR